MSNMIISSSILSADFAFLHDQIKLAEAAGVDWLHIDVMDGKFAPNLSMGPFIVETCNRITDLPLDVHLMIEHPENHVEAFAKAGADSITIHIEGNPNIHRTLQQIHSLNCRAGVAINPGTSACSLDAILSITDMILVMTVNPGYSGQSFIPETVQKVEKIKRMIDLYASNILLQVDGGITSETLPVVKNAGANVIVAASAIFKFPQGILAGVQALRKASD